MPDSSIYTILIKPIFSIFSKCTSFLHVNYLENKAHDAELYRCILQEMPLSSELISFLRYHDIKGSFPRQRLSELKDFINKFDQPHILFKCKSINRQRKNFLKKLKRLQDLLSLNAYPSRTNCELCTIKWDFYHDNDVNDVIRLDNLAANINGIASAAYIEYEKIISMCARKYNIDIR